MAHMVHRPLVVVALLVSGSVSLPRASPAKRPPRAHCGCCLLPATAWNQGAGDWRGFESPVTTNGKCPLPHRMCGASKACAWHCMVAIATRGMWLLHVMCCSGHASFACASSIPCRWCPWTKCLYCYVPCNARKGQTCTDGLVWSWKGGRRDVLLRNMTHCTTETYTANKSHATRHKHTHAHVHTHANTTQGPGTATILKSRPVDTITSTSPPTRQVTRHT